MTQSCSPSQPAPLEIHGHRGARGVLPENTLIGYAYALSLGVAQIELDVLLTGDGVVVATHNPRLEAASTRDTDGSWLTETGPEVGESAFDRLQAFDIGALRPGSDYGDRFPDQAMIDGARIPSLDQVIALTKRDGDERVKLNIELKSDPEDTALAGRRDRLVDAVLECVHRHDFADRVQLQSFDWAVMERIAVYAPEITRSYLTLKPYGETEKGTFYEDSPWLGRLKDRVGEGAPTLVSVSGGKVWTPYFADLTKEDLDKAHAYGLKVMVWTVNDAADIERMIQMGVDGIISDYPARVQRAKAAQLTEL